MRSLLIILSLLIWTGVLSGQDTTVHHPDTLPDRFYILENVEREGVSLPEIELDEVNVVRRLGISGRFKWWKHRRLVYNVKKVYPYVVLVRDNISEVNDSLLLLPDDKSRRRYLKAFEKEIFADYEGDMRKMTITQGKILIKLIDRETQNTGYDLIKVYRGSVSAIFWQGIARFFGTNLKARYDRDGEDYLIEKVIYEIEEGRL